MPQADRTLPDGMFMDLAVPSEASPKRTGEVQNGDSSSDDEDHRHHRRDKDAEGMFGRPPPSQTFDLSWSISDETSAYRARDLALLDNKLPEQPLRHW